MKVNMVWPAESTDRSDEHRVRESAALFRSGRDILIICPMVVKCDACRRPEQCNPCGQVWMIILMMMTKNILPPPNTNSIFDLYSERPILNRGLVLG